MKKRNALLSGPDDLPAGPFATPFNIGTTTWFGFHADGKNAGEWRRFDMRTAAAIITRPPDGPQAMHLYEKTGGKMYVVVYDLHLITPIPGGIHFWLVERSRQRYDGVL